MHPVRLALPLALTLACAAPRPPPPLHAHVIGPHRVELRDYRSGAPCTAEPRWLLDELRGPLSLVRTFLRTAGTPVDGEWTDQGRAFLAQAHRELPPLLEILEATLEATRRCSFGDEPAFRDLRKEGRARTDAARRVLPVVPDLLDHLEARQTRARWKAMQWERQADARHRCPRPSLVPYYAVRGCAGATEWFFCDGTRVTREPGQGPVFLPGPSWSPPPPAPKRSRRGRPAPPPPPSAEAYLAAAERSTELDSCPPLPAVPPVPVPTQR